MEIALDVRADALARYLAYEYEQPYPLARVRAEEILALLASMNRTTPVRVVYEGEDPEMDAFWHSHMAADQRDREAEQRTRYESHQWNPTDDDQECIVCGVTWVDCDDDCPGPAPSPSRL